MIHGGHRVQNEICVIGLKSAEKNKTTTYSDRNPQPATRNSSNTFALNPRNWAQICGKATLRSLR